MNFCFFVLITLLVSINLASSNFCNYDNDENIYKGKLSTKTSYVNSIKDKSFEDEFMRKVNHCTPIKFWSFTRHGTRYPIKSDLKNLDLLHSLVDGISVNHFQNKGCLSETEVFEFKKWFKPYQIRDLGELHSVGADELYSIGRQWKNLFPDLFGNTYSSSKIKVQHTVRNRTGQSAYHFLRGVYGDEAVGTIEIPKPFDPNYVLRFYKACNRWMTEVYRNEDVTYKQRNLFAQNDTFVNMAKDVSNRLGYDYALELEFILAMFDECRFETAWSPRERSIWCTPFSNQDFEILEYHQDLKYYYEDSYGTLMNNETACKTASDLYLFLKNVDERKNELLTTVLYFTHDKAILQFQTLLGLHKPKFHLRHDNFDVHRLFKTSHFGPFATNLVFVMYRCGQSHHVGLFLNGYPVPLPSVCPDVLCTLQDYETFLQPISDNCDLAKLCNLHDEL